MPTKQELNIQPIEGIPPAHSPLTSTLISVVENREANIEPTQGNPEKHYTINKTTINRFTKPITVGTSIEIKNIKRLLFSTIYPSRYKELSDEILELPKHQLLLPNSLVDHNSNEKEPAKDTDIFKTPNNIIDFSF